MRRQRGERGCICVWACGRWSWFLQRGGRTPVSVWMLKAFLATPTGREGDACKCVDAESVHGPTHGEKGHTHECVGLESIRGFLNGGKRRHVCVSVEHVRVPLFRGYGEHVCIYVQSVRGSSSGCVCMLKAFLAFHMKRGVDGCVCVYIYKAFITLPSGGEGDACVCKCKARSWLPLRRGQETPGGVFVC